MAKRKPRTTSKSSSRKMTPREILVSGIGIVAILLKEIGLVAAFLALLSGGYDVFNGVISGGFIKICGAGVGAIIVYALHMLLLNIGLGIQNKEKNADNFH